MNLREHGLTAERILSVAIVDDADELRSLLRMQVDAAPDFRVCAEGGDGAAAVAIAEDLRPDVIVLDLSMPGMDGLTALPLILERSPTTRVVVLSGTMSQESTERARALGAVACLEKTLSAGPLADRLRAVLTSPE